MREQIWTDYVQRMVRDKGDAKRYPLSVTTNWLRWLASEMRQHNQAIFSLEALQPDWLPVSQRKRYRWSVVLAVVLAAGSIFGLAVWLLFGLVAGLVTGLPFGLIAGLVAGLAARVEPAEILTWSWKKLWQWLLFGLVVGLAVWLLFGLIAGLLSGFSGGQLTQRLVLSPNEGMHRSLKNGLAAGLVAGLLFGLGAAVQHYILRFWLARSGIFPWRAVSFLEDATARILLRRVGGGYSFAHRLLLDYFADLDAQAPLAREAAQTTSTSVQTKAALHQFK